MLLVGIQWQFHTIPNVVLTQEETTHILVMNLILISEMNMIENITENTVLGRGTSRDVWGFNGHQWVRYGALQQVDAFDSFEAFLDAFLEVFVEGASVAQVHKTQRIDIRLSIAQALVRLAMRISIKSIEFMWR